MGQPYSYRFQADGLSAPYTWRLESGALPLGLTMTRRGHVSGTPTEVGHYEAVVRVSGSRRTLQGGSTQRYIRDFLFIVDP